jgi:glutaryl-CoA dehydrogenase
MTSSPRTFSVADPAGIDLVLSQQERDVRDAVRRFCDDRVEPHVATWFEQGEFR